MKITQKMWFWPFVILTFATALSLGISFFGSKLYGSEKSNSVVSCTTNGDFNAEADYYQCLKKKYESITELEEPKAAFADLKSAYEVDPIVKSQCHQLTHVIGRTAVEKYPDIQKAYSNGDNFCWSGYYHGVMESTVNKMGKERVVAGANEICADLRQNQQYSFFHYNCAHGLGHGFMGMNSNELFVSLSTCDLLKDPWERESCYGGVFMENVMIVAGQAGYSKFLKEDDLVYPCNAVGNQYKEQCYLMQTSYALSNLGYDFSKGFEFCNGVESAHRNTCYTSLGRDASGSTVSDAARTKEHCLKGETEEARRYCVEGAVKDFISYFHSDKQAREFCGTLPDELISNCRKVAADYYSSF